MSILLTFLLIDKNARPKSAQIDQIVDLLGPTQGVTKSVVRHAFARGLAKHQKNLEAKGIDVEGFFKGETSGESKVRGGSVGEEGGDGEKSGKRGGKAAGTGGKRKTVEKNGAPNKRGRPSKKEKLTGEILPVAEEAGCERGGLGFADEPLDGGL